MDFILSISNIEFIKKEVESSGLTYSHLMDELIDHVCCDVENEMHNGLPFAKAYEVVKDKIGIEGLERIQHETLYLIDKKYRIMKNTMKISGLIAPILLAFGALSKIQHWPGAVIFLVLGFFLLSFIFLPSAIYVNYKEVSNLNKKWTHIMGFLGTFFVSLGFLFKIQHWPGASIIITAGMMIICLIFLPMVLKNRLKDEKDSVPKFIYFIAFAGFIIYEIAFLFRIIHWPYASYPLLVGCVLLVFVAFPLYVYNKFKNHRHISNSFVFTLIVLVWFIIPTTLISLNSSRNILHNVEELNQTMSKDLDFLGERNSEMIAHINDPLALDIKDGANNLMICTEDIKKALVNEGMLESVKFDNLTKLLNSFQKKLFSVSIDEKYQSIVSQTLINPLKLKEKPYDDPAFSLHNLIFLQLNIRLAEQTALRQLNQKEKETILALNN